MQLHHKETNIKITDWKSWLNKYVKFSILQKAVKFFMKKFIKFCKSNDTGFFSAHEDLKGKEIEQLQMYET